jgi:predicted RNase H-like nuclease
MYADTVFIGIDPTAGKRPMNYAVLDVDTRVVANAAGDLAAVLAAIEQYPAAVVAVDAPQSPNGGLMANTEFRATLSPRPNGRAYAQYKVCEYELRHRGIGLYSTPGDAGAAPAWMQMGFQLYAALQAAGFVFYRPGSAAPRQVLEVHPHASYTVLLGHLPLRKDTLEGRLQRQMLLYREGVRVPDPMDTLEELTPHRLLDGTFELPGLHNHDELDALIAAYTAYLAGTAPEQVTAVGDAGEGQIVVPVAAGELKSLYTK